MTLATVTATEFNGNFTAAVKQFEGFRDTIDIMVNSLNKVKNRTK